LSYSNTNGNEEVLFSARWSTITLAQKRERFLNAHLYVRRLAGSRSAEIYANGILYKEHCVFHKVITPGKLRLEI
jgi:hypothetical protein